MKWYKVVDGIGNGATCSIIASIAAMGIASGVGIFNNASENYNNRVERSVNRVLQVGAIIVTASALTATLSAYLWYGRADSDEEVELNAARDRNWERLVSMPQAWDGQYCAAACKGCKHLVGNINRDKFMICAMHPYGWKGSECPDWHGRRL